MAMSDYTPNEQRLITAMGKQFVQSAEFNCHPPLLYAAMAAYCFVHEDIPANVKAAVKACYTLLNYKGVGRTTPEFEKAITDNLDATEVKSREEELEEALKMALRVLPPEALDDNDNNLYDAIVKILYKKRG